jgi:hypothetical protein
LASQKYSVLGHKLLAPSNNILKGKKTRVSSQAALLTGQMQKYKIPKIPDDFYNPDTEPIPIFLSNTYTDTNPVSSSSSFSSQFKKSNFQTRKNCQ